MTEEILKKILIELEERATVAYLRLLRETDADRLTEDYQDFLHVGFMAGYKIAVKEMLDMRMRQSS